MIQPPPNIPAIYSERWNNRLPEEADFWKEVERAIASGTPLPPAPPRNGCTLRYIDHTGGRAGQNGGLFYNTTRHEWTLAYYAGNSRRSKILYGATTEGQAKEERDKFHKWLRDQGGIPTRHARKCGDNENLPPGVYKTGKPYSIRTPEGKTLRFKTAAEAIKALAQVTKCPN
jgi:hypothetical protein